MENKEKNNLKKCDKQKVYDKEEIDDLKESYKLGKEYYKNVEKKIKNK